MGRYCWKKSIFRLLPILDESTIAVVYKVPLVQFSSFFYLEGAVKKAKLYEEFEFE